ncbi:MAG: DUF3482 domain-containing protein [Burkholderiales bacterium]|nr:DUF3482 domain-containing protein [Burkholderiales bacterium]
METDTLHLDQADARRLVLVRAIEEADPQGRLLGEAERERIERDALDASRRSGAGVDFADYLGQRARRVLATVELRNPRLANLQATEPWRGWLMTALPLAACVLGAAIDRIDNPHQVNMLSPPLLGVLAWNVVVYLLLLVSVLRPRRAPDPAAPPGLRHWLTGRGWRSGRLRADVLARFHQQWLKTAGAQEWLWWERLLHLCAAGWALGLALSIVLGGIVREYRVGWESTLLDVRQVHALLSALFAPVVALLPFEPFTVADLQRLAFGSGAPVDVGEARRWVWMYVALLGVVVVVPRLLLAAGAAWGERRRRRAVRIDLRDPYYARLLASVSPARVMLAVLASEGGGGAALQRMLREVADEEWPRANPWTVLGNSRGDRLRVFEVPPGYRPPGPAVPAHAGGPAATQAWLQDLLGRFKALPAEGAGDAVATGLADTDVVLLLPASPVDLEDATPLLHLVARPALLLVPGDEVPYRSVVQRLGLAAEVLRLDRCLGHWLRDPLLLGAVAARVASGKRAGFERLAAKWQERQATRFSDAMRLVAGELARAARDVENVAAGPAGLRQLLSPAERDSVQRAREAARAALLQRLRDGEAATRGALVRLYRSGEPAAAAASGRLGRGFHEQRTVDTPQAGMAGAATGAAMGAGIDLLTGGLTLGAATALGAMIGGGAAYAAAAWKNRGSSDGQPQVQVGDELLQALAESLLVSYVEVAHRTWPEAAEAPPPSWRDEVVAAVEARRGELSPLWQQGRAGDAQTHIEPPLARLLEEIARGLLMRL